MSNQDWEQRIKESRLRSKKAAAIGATGVIGGILIILLGNDGGRPNVLITIPGLLIALAGVFVLLGGLIFYFFVYRKP